MEYATVWENCLQVIRQSVDPQSYQTWFVPIRPIALQSNELTIQVPHRLFYEYLEEHYIEVLKRGLNSSLGTAGRLQYRIKATRPAPPPTAPGHEKGRTATRRRRRATPS